MDRRDVEEPMEVGDALEAELDVVEVVEMEVDLEEREEMEKLKRRRKKFRDKMTRFDHFAELSGLRVEHLDWPMIKGRHLQREPLTGPSFDHGDQYEPQYNLQTWPRETLLQITATQLFTAGVGLINNPDVTLFVFQRTMRCLAAYCSFMYNDAVAHRRKQINKYSLHRLIAMSDFRLHMFYRKFLPNPDPLLETFPNQYTALLNENYFNNPDCQALYHDPAHNEPVNIRGNRLTSQQLMFLPSEFQIQPQYDPVYFTNFINPTGFCLSRFHAYRFHEALGSPPIESEIIIVLDWMAKLVINEISYKTLVWQDNQGLQGCPTLHCYQMAMENEGDPLFGLDIDFTNRYRPTAKGRAPYNVYPKFVPHRRIRFSKLLDRYYKKVRRERAMQDFRDTYYNNKYPTKMFCGCVYSSKQERKR